jgi:uncharacterized SAM-binding protein YcdF (DUF218 family)
MFFYASKLLFLFVQPSNFLALLVACGWLLRRRWPDRRAGRNVMLAGVAGLALCGLTPAGIALLLPLEERFGGQVPAAPKGDIAGILILGGFEDGWVSGGRGGLAVNEAGERLVEGVRLARALPAAKVVFTGGDGNFVWSQTAAIPVRRYLLDVGIAEARVVIEDKSRTTWENAAYLREMLDPKPGQRWLLVTSAFHMPRSVGTFRQAGFDVVPYPVDFRTRDRGDLTRFFTGIGGCLERVDFAVKEYIGLAAYRLSGRSNALFPAP